MEYNGSYNHYRSLLLYSILNYKPIPYIPDVLIFPKGLPVKISYAFLILMHNNLSNLP
jgi:hypothetical protein